MVIDICGQNIEVEENGIIRDATTGIVLNQNKNPNGYIRVYIPSLQKRYSVHRLVAMAFIPNDDNKPYVNHIDGNKSNNNASNLEWCTQKENINHYHMCLKGRKTRPNESILTKSKDDIRKDEILAVIGEYCNENNVSEREFCRRCGIGNGILSKWRNEERIPSISTINRILNTIPAKEAYEKALKVYKCMENT